MTWPCPTAAAGRGGAVAPCGAPAMSPVAAVSHSPAIPIDRALLTWPSFRPIVYRRQAEKTYQDGQFTARIGDADNGAAHHGCPPGPRDHWSSSFSAFLTGLSGMGIPRSFISSRRSGAVVSRTLLLRTSVAVPRSATSRGILP